MTPVTRSEDQEPYQVFAAPQPVRRGLALAAGVSLAAAVGGAAAPAPATGAPLSVTPAFVRTANDAPVPSPELLMTGARGAAVKQLQQALGLSPTGVFGAGTRSAVVSFQRVNHLPGDGVVGPQTRTALHLRVRIVGPASSPSITAGTGAYSIPASIVLCESGGNYSAVNPTTGAGGAYQILPSTWAAYGGTGLPQNAPAAEQNAIAAKIYATAGPSQWSC